MPRGQNNKNAAEDSKTERSKKRLLAELEAASGIIAFACKKAKISRMTFYRWCKEDAEFKERAEDIQELQIDVAEAKLLTKIQNGDTTAIIFYLKTKGKNRGYSERREITGANGGEIQMSEVDISTLSKTEREALLRVAEQQNNNNK